MEVDETEEDDAGIKKPPPLAERNEGNIPLPRQPPLPPDSAGVDERTARLERPSPSSPARNHRSCVSYAKEDRPEGLSSTRPPALPPEPPLMDTMLDHDDDLFPLGRPPPEPEPRLLETGVHPLLARPSALPPEPFPEPNDVLPLGDGKEATKHIAGLFNATGLLPPLPEPDRNSTQNDMVPPSLPDVSNNPNNEQLQYSSMVHQGYTYRSEVPPEPPDLPPNETIEVNAQQGQPVNVHPPAPPDSAIDFEAIDSFIALHFQKAEMDANELFLSLPDFGLPSEEQDVVEDSKMPVSFF